MKPILVTSTGIALGLAVVLPLAHGQLVADTGGPLAVTASAPVVAADPTADPTAGTPAKASPRATATKTVTGPSVATRYGPVQVRIVLTNRRISSVTAVDLPASDRRSREISSWSGPQLVAETMAAQSAQVDTVSGASYTSRGYRTSLQAALDTARTQGLYGT